MSEPAYNPDPAGWAQGEPGKVIPLPTREGEPDKVQILAEKVQALADENAALLKSLANAEKSNRSLGTQLKKAKEAKTAIELAAERYDPDKVRDLIVWHWKQQGRTKDRDKIALDGADAEMVRWLLNACRWEPRDVAYASIGFAEMVEANAFYKRNNLRGVRYMVTVKVDGARIKDQDYADGFREAGKKLRGKAA